MSLSDLTDREREIVHRCLRVAADESSIFPDWEFHTLFGFYRPEFVAIADRWPRLDESSRDVSDAINNAMNHLLGYPHKWHKEWSSHFDFTRDELLEVFGKWRGSQTWSYVECLR